MLSFQIIFEIFKQYLRVTVTNLTLHPLHEVAVHIKLYGSLLYKISSQRLYKTSQILAFILLAYFTYMYLYIHKHFMIKYLLPICTL